MSREVRRVPATWQHPREDGRYKHLFEGDPNLKQEIEEWHRDNELWKLGKHPDQVRRATTGLSFEDWSGGPPDPRYYMPCWPDAEKTHYQMYETTSEGSPLSPPMESPEALARWLVDNRASAFGNETATYEDWLDMIRGPGWAPTAMQIGGELQSGVKAMAKENNED